MQRRQAAIFGVRMGPCIMPYKRSPVQCRPPFVGFGIDVGVVGQQQCHDLRVAKRLDPFQVAIAGGVVNLAASLALLHASEASRAAARKRIEEWQSHEKRAFVIFMVALIDSI
jgi:hypothetical protein